MGGRHKEFSRWKREVGLVVKEGRRFGVNGEGNRVRRKGDRGWKGREVKEGRRLGK